MKEVITSRILRTIPLLCLACFLCVVPSAFAGSIVSCGSMAIDSSQLDANDFAAIAAGRGHSPALRSDGSIVGLGRNDFGQAAPPAGNEFVDETANDTDDIWWIVEGRGYPKLWWELLEDGIAESFLEEKQS